MNTRLITYFVIIATLFISCDNQNPLPENNSFSYLDSLKVENVSVNKSTKDQETSDKKITIHCPNIHRELLGNIYQKSERIKKSNEYKSYIVLILNTQLTLDCDDNQKKTVENVQLELTPDFNIDQYFGYSVMVVGEISLTDDEFYPIKMDVLRIEPIKGAVIQ